MECGGRSAVRPCERRSRPPPPKAKCATTTFTLAVLAESWRLAALLRCSDSQMTANHTNALLIEPDTPGTRRPPSPPRARLRHLSPSPFSLSTISAHHHKIQ